MITLFTYQDNTVIRYGPRAEVDDDDLYWYTIL